MSRKTHRQFSKQKLPLDTVSQLLPLVWGVTGYRYSPRFGKLFHKTSPSSGARHPGEVYLMALRVKGLRAGLYHYQSATSSSGDGSLQIRRARRHGCIAPAKISLKTRLLYS